MLISIINMSLLLFYIFFFLVKNSHFEHKIEFFFLKNKFHFLDLHI
jgi:hypothetical protein